MPTFKVLVSLTDGVEQEQTKVLLVRCEEGQEPGELARAFYAEEPLSQLDVVLVQELDNASVVEVVGF